MLINAIDLLSQSNPGLNGQAPGDLAGLFASLLQNALGNAAPGEQRALLEKLDSLTETSDTDTAIGDLLSGIGGQTTDLASLLQLLAAEASATTAPAAAAGSSTEPSSSSSSAAGQPAAPAAPAAQQALAGVALPDDAAVEAQAASSSDLPEAPPSTLSRSASPAALTTPQPQGAREPGATASGNAAARRPSGVGPAPATVTVPSAMAASGEVIGQQTAGVQDTSPLDDSELSVSNRQRQSAPALPLSNQVTAAILSSTDQSAAQVSGQVAARQQVGAQPGQRDPRAPATGSGPAQGAEHAGNGSTPSGAGGQATGASAASGSALPDTSGPAAAQARPSPETAPAAISGDTAASHQGQTGLQPSSGSLSGTTASDAAAQSGQPKSQAHFVKPAEQIALHINRGLGEGRDRITVQLEPAELGRIEVKLDLAKDGTLRAMILADKPDTLDMLQRDSRALERALQDAGLKTGSESLSFSLRGDGQNDQLARQRDRTGEDGGPDTQLPDESSPSPDHATRRSTHHGSLDISV